jgi:undecaprenyl-diphosphatase
MSAPALREGQDMLVLYNPEAGRAGGADDLRDGPLSRAEFVEWTPELDVDSELTDRGGRVEALGVVGGDGTVTAVASVAVRWGLPVAVFPSGTLNHFARDVGALGVGQTIAAVQTGQAVTVDIATADDTAFLNTACIGAYPEIVRRRDDLAPKLGKWMAMAVATAQVLRRQEPLDLVINGEPVQAWIVFVGNGRYVARGPFPAWRPNLSDGLLDVHLLKAGPWSRTRAVLAALLGRTERTEHYDSRSMNSVHIDSRSGPVEIATDGEPGKAAQAFEFGKLPDRLLVYRPSRPSRG